MKVKVEKLYDDVELPAYGKIGDAGMDVRAYFPKESEKRHVVISGQSSELIKTGIKVAIPMGYEIQVRPRSGLALKESITVLNTPGTIDSGYRGEIGIILMNHSTHGFLVDNGERIAQLVLKQVETIEWEEVDKVDETERGEGGFGSTGV